VAFPAESPFAEKVNLKAGAPVAEGITYCGLLVDTIALEAGAGAALTVTWVNDPVAGVTVTVIVADAPTAST
jgi:hypothetical protein